MQENKGYNLSQSTIYQKSLEVFRLSRSVAAYVTNDKSINKMYLSKSASDKYANILVMDSLGLVPKIAETEIQENPRLKLKYAKSLQYFIDNLYTNCVKLENTKIQGKDFVRLLRKELILLKRMHRRYVNSLL
ncbi:hypothetical protein MKD41_07845 [Lutibacter sp. A64]|uniref:hypothetical protein n=1 Tax=Lutibacter sp. A64 TaxID=2918526 RepID=UPI001F065ED6|nr:hypothetical protein [Lutibacter sp. A64]UMB55372.1 hypothetical protein MKD41_07845 [Lutibacter sp. A64]